MLVTLVRHGQTEENFSGIIQGSSNTMLNDTGRRECERLKNKLRNVKYDYCYTSPMIRAVETAIILVGDRTEIIPDNRLVEREMGEFEGKDYHEYKALDYWDYNINNNSRGVEPIQDVFNRCDDFLTYIKSKHSNEKILIVTHGAPYLAMRHLLLKHKLQGNLRDFDIKNCQNENFEL